MTFIKIFFMAFMLIHCADGGEESSETSVERHSSQEARAQGPQILNDGAIFGANGTETGYYKTPNGEIYDRDNNFTGFMVVDGSLNNSLGDKTGYRVLGSGIISGCADLTTYPLLRKIFGVWSPLADVKCKKQN